ncbi:MAG TPA: hypothetical protein PLO85_05940 [Candidatus Omnitrophota bacterium]|nr:hypothetical protein [Candidatus Omnitrophota bacterium]
MKTKLVFATATIACGVLLGIFHGFQHKTPAVTISPIHYQNPYELKRILIYQTAILVSLGEPVAVITNR